MVVDINDLPDEVLEFILSYLPPYKDLEECQVVCKRWNMIVKNVMHRTKLSLRKGLIDSRLCWKSNVCTAMTPTIAGRFSHSAVIHENSMYVFGGGSSSDTTFNDLWRFDLSKRQWVRPLSMGSYPSPKGSASMVCYGDRLILFGGWRYPSLHPPYHPWYLFDELHLYHIKDNRWTVQISMPSPPPMAGHSATVHKKNMIVFGGYQLNNEVNFFSNDIWCLNLDNFAWKKKDVSNTKPPPRYGQFQIALDDNNLLILGGCGGPNNMFSDAWVLNMTSNVWQWRNIPVRNRKWAATHMWCNPACKVGTKLVVLGPTPALPCDFQILRPQRPNSRVRVQQVPRVRRFDNQNGGGDLDENAIAVAVVAGNNRVPQNNNNNINNNNLNNNNNVLANNGAVQLVRQRDHGNHENPLRRPEQNMQIYQQNNINNINEDEAANRLQRNLALRSREDNPQMPKRFGERYEDRFRMAAFSVEGRTRSISRERQQERVRRMEEKMNALRNSRRNIEKPAEEPSPKKSRRNSLAMFVCDISNVLADEPYIEWIEHKNYGILNGAPERLILSTIVPGNGELIMFGGVHKETLAELTHQVSNSVHFLTAPKEII